MDRADHERALAEIRGEIEAIKRRLRDLRAAERYHHGKALEPGEAAGEDAPTGGQADEPIPDGPFKGLTAIQAAESLLEKVKTPISSSDTARYLATAGLPADNPGALRDLLHASMRRRPEVFVAVRGDRGNVLWLLRRRMAEMGIQQGQLVSA